MNPTDFKRLVASIKQAGKIRRGQLRPARVTPFAGLSPYGLIPAPSCQPAPDSQDFGHVRPGL